MISFTSPNLQTSSIYLTTSTIMSVMLTFQLWFKGQAITFFWLLDGLTSTRGNWNKINIIFYFFSIMEMHGYDWLKIQNQKSLFEIKTDKFRTINFEKSIMKLNPKMHWGLIWPPSPRGLLRNKSYKERKKPCFSVTFNIMISHLFS